MSQLTLNNEIILVFFVCISEDLMYLLGISLFLTITSFSSFLTWNSTISKVLLNTGQYNQSTAGRNVKRRNSVEKSDVLYSKYVQHSIKIIQSCKWIWILECFFCLWLCVLCVCFLLGFFCFYRVGGRGSAASFILVLLSILTLCCLTNCSTKYEDGGKIEQRETKVWEHVLQRSGRSCFYCVVCTDLVGALLE